MSSDDELSTYELQRRQNIAANAAHLRTLDLGPDHASTRALAPKQPRKQQTPRPSSAPRTQPVRITRNSSTIYREAPATPRSSVRRGTIDVTSHQRAEPSSHRAAMNIGQSSPAPLPARWGARVPHYMCSRSCRWRLHGFAAETPGLCFSTLLRRRCAAAVQLGPPAMLSTRLAIAGVCPRLGR